MSADRRSPARAGAPAGGEGGGGGAPPPIVFTVDGEPYAAAEGQTLAAALLVAGRTELRRSPSGAPRGLYCGIGICHECRVEVVGRGVVRSCLVPAEAGMEVLTSLD